MSLLDLIDENEDYEPIKSPFGWAGSKSRSLKHLNKFLPFGRVYVEPFGGSGAVLLSRPPSLIEVFNDRYSGIVDFFRCIRNPETLPLLIERLDLATYSREDWLMCKCSWEATDNIVERAARWYTMIEYSFGSMGRNFGRTLGASKIAGKLQRKLPLFPRIHERMSNVLLENCGWERFFADYNFDDAIMYCDPPYLGTDTKMYKCAWTLENQLALLKAIFDYKGYVALSGYDLSINDKYPWDDCFEWEVSVSIKSAGNSERNHKSGIETGRGRNIEKLWIKEAY